MLPEFENEGNYQAVAGLGEAREAWPPLKYSRL